MHRESELHLAIPLNRVCIEPLMNPSGIFIVIEVAGIGRLADRLRLKETLSRRQRCRVNEFA